MNRPRVRAARVYDKPSRQDGVRVLVDRLWPRGMTKAGAALDEWCRQVAPSTGLRRWYGHDPSLFAQFRQRYLTELADGAPSAALAHLRDLASQGPVTLLTASKDLPISEAAVLAEVIERDLSGEETDAASVPNRRGEPDEEGREPDVGAPSPPVTDRSEELA